MKKRILALGCMAALLAFSSDAFALVTTSTPPIASGSALGNATATIGTAISISQTSTGNKTGGDLAFGHIIPGTGGTLEIKPDGTINVSSGITSTTQLPKGPAYFKVTGDSNASYTATLPSSSTTISNGTVSMSVTGLNSNSSGHLSSASLGEEVFQVGGVLNVGAGQATGSYKGTFVVNAAYN